jgi:hypothetical protein
VDKDNKTCPAGEKANAAGKCEKSKTDQEDKDKDRYCALFTGRNALLTRYTGKRKSVLAVGHAWLLVL